MVLRSDINKQNIIALYHFLRKIFSKLLKNEFFYVNAIIYLSILTIILTVISSRASENKIENQLQWLNSQLLEDRFYDRHNSAKLLNPLLQSGILRATNPEGYPQDAYNAYLEFINKKFNFEIERKAEIALVKTFDDLQKKINDLEITRALETRNIYSENIILTGKIANWLFPILIIIQLFIVLMTTNLETMRFRKTKDK